MEEVSSLRTENALLRNRLTEAEVDLQQREEERREVRRQLADLARSNADLEARVEEHRAACARQVERLQGQLEDRNHQISLLASQKELLEDSTNGLTELLRRANAKIVELTRELADRNRFIKEYIGGEEV